MSRHIDAEQCPKLFDEEYKATRKLIEEGEKHLDNLAEGFMEAHSVILRMPTADVEEVRHAAWIKDERQRRDDRKIYDYCCSLCKGAASKGEYGNYDVFTDFCPHCGAKMDLT